MTPIRLSLCRDRFDSQPRTLELSPAELSALLSEHARTKPDKEGTGIVGAVFDPARSSDPTKYRRLECVEAVTALVLDFDGGELADPQRAIAATGRQAFGWSSYNHGNPEKWEPSHPRFRVLLPLARDVSPGDYPALVAWASRVFGDGIDPASRPTQLQYTPRRRNPAAEVEPWLIRGDPQRDRRRAE